MDSLNFADFSVDAHAGGATGLPTRANRSNVTGFADAGTWQHKHP